MPKNREGDPAHTDNEALCQPCRCLVDQHAVCDGYLITHEHSEASEEEASRQYPFDRVTSEPRWGPHDYWDRSVYTKLNVPDDENIYHGACPLCQEFLRCRQTNDSVLPARNGTVKHAIVVRILRLSPPGLPRHGEAHLLVKYNNEDGRKAGYSTSKLKIITEKRR